MPRHPRTVPFLSSLLVSAFAFAACTGRMAPPVSAPEAGEAAAIPFFEERALLLLMEDRRVTDPALVERFTNGTAPVREMAAAALGRIGDRAFRPALEVLLIDSEPAVRRAAAFA